MSQLTHRQRLERCLADEPLDQTPVALWRHFPVDDQTPAGLAAAALNFQKTYDFDLVKYTPASSFCIKDWGSQDEWQGNTEGVREYTHNVIQQPEDWLNLTVLDPYKGHLGAQLESLQRLVDELGSDTPVIQTIFNPLSQAKNLVGKDRLAGHVRHYPDAVLAGLKTITQTTLQFLEAAIETGIAGIFFAVQHAQYGIFSRGEYRKFGRAFDLELLQPAENLWLNMLHIHGTDIYFDEFLDYPIQIINWHDRETAPNLAEAQQKYAGVLCGGLRRWETMLLGAAADVTAEAQDAINQTQGRRFILGTGCVTPITIPHGNLMAVRHAAQLKPQ